MFNLKIYPTSTYFTQAVPPLPPPPPPPPPPFCISGWHSRWSGATNGGSHQPGGVRSKERACIRKRLFELLTEGNWEELGTMDLATKPSWIDFCRIVSSGKHLVNIIIV